MKIRNRRIEAVPLQPKKFTGEVKEGDLAFASYRGYTDLCTAFLGGSLNDDSRSKKSRSPKTLK